MNWRTDKPTADVIVAKFNNIYEILNRDEQGNYFLQDGFVKKVMLTSDIEKWADLEKDETVTDCNEFAHEIDFTSKLEEELEAFYCEEMSLNRQRFNQRISGKDKLLPFCVMWDELLKIARHFAKWGMEHREQPMIDEDEVDDAAYDYVMDNFGNPKESLFDFDRRCFKAGAKWGAEHLKK